MPLQEFIATHFGQKSDGQQRFFTEYKEKNYVVSRVDEEQKEIGHIDLLGMFTDILTKLNDQKIQQYVVADFFYLIDVSLEAMFTEIRQPISEQDKADIKASLVFKLNSQLFDSLASSESHLKADPQEQLKLLKKYQELIKKSEVLTSLAKVYFADKTIGLSKQIDDFYQKKYDDLRGSYKLPAEKVDKDSFYQTVDFDSNANFKALPKEYRDRLVQSLWSQHLAPFSPTIEPTEEVSKLIQGFNHSSLVFEKIKRVVNQRKEHYTNEFNKFETSDVLVDEQGHLTDVGRTARTTLINKIQDEPLDDKVLQFLICCKKFQQQLDLTSEHLKMKESQWFKSESKPYKALSVLFQNLDTANKNLKGDSEPNAVETFKSQCEAAFKEAEDCLATVDAPGFWETYIAPMLSALIDLLQSLKVISNLSIQKKDENMTKIDDIRKAYNFFKDSTAVIEEKADFLQLN